MTHKEEIQNQMNELALLTIERILNSANVPTDEGKLKLISYVVGAATQSMPELEYNV